MSNLRQKICAKYVHQIAMVSVVKQRCNSMVSEALIPDSQVDTVQPVAISLKAGRLEMAVRLHAYLYDSSLFLHLFR